jgi:aspartate kinase
LVKNVFDLSSEGTRIDASSSPRRTSVVKAVTHISRVGMVTVTGANMVDLAGAAARVFRVLGDANINILMISQSSSERDISLVVQRDRLQQTVTALKRGMLGGVVKDVNTESDVCVISAVGSGMKGTPGVAARLLKAVAENGVNVRMIAQGSSELNISFVVSEADGPKVVNAIHEEFNLNKI